MELYGTRLGRLLDVRMIDACRLSVKGSSIVLCILPYFLLVPQPDISALIDFQFSFRCSYFHNNKLIMLCDLCGCTYHDDSHLSHINGKQHQKNLHNDNAKYCDLCACWCLRSFRQHEAGKRHQKNLEESRNTQVRSIYDLYTQGHNHRRSLSGALIVTERENYGIQLSGDSLDFGVVDGNTVPIRQLWIKNNGSEMIIIRYICLSFSTSLFKIVQDKFYYQLCRMAETSTIIKLAPAAEDLGMFEDRLEIHFDIPSLRKQFAITKPMKVIIGSKSDHDALQPIRPYIKPQRKFFGKMMTILPGIPPQFITKTKWIRKCNEYKLPREKIDAIFRDNISSQKLIDAARKYFGIDKFYTHSYTKYMQAMLWIEEDQAIKELEQYNMEKVDMNPSGIYYELKVEGLAEKRPSVILGDSILVRTSGEGDHWSQGYVHIVKDRSVLLRFDEKFRGLKGQKYDVIFQPNRTVSRRMHQAVASALDSRRITFPGSSVSNVLPTSTPSDDSLRFFDRKIQSNPAQLQAVAAIAHLPRGCVPFIVYGPPGTGKTVTIVEAIRQVLEDPDAKVLACAPSNAAADIITERLSKLSNKVLYRLMSPSRSNAKDMIPKTVLSFTRINKENNFECPPREELENYRVIVSTCSSAFVPYGLGVNPGHFSHIFVDEAGQATEPEVMIPIRTLLGPNTRVILSGDIKQLGPIVRSPLARNLGLGVSFLERLMKDPLYDETKGRGRTFVKLTKNWRSHSVILKFASDEFYAGELECCADPVITHSIQSWSKLKRPDRPILFHGIRGKDRREASSPSYFNIEEASLVKDYVKELLEEKGLRLKPTDIGVITPYRAQVSKIRSLLGPFAKETRVGSVEEYQGQERRVIIISTVRSNQDFINFDLKHSLGFVASPRRFNVAETRAQALLLVIGDPFVLSLDPLWKTFINYVHKEGNVYGTEIDWDYRTPFDRSEDLAKARRTQEQARLIELIERTSERNLGLGDGVDEAYEVGAYNRPFREES